MKKENNSIISLRHKDHQTISAYMNSLRDLSGIKYITDPESQITNQYVRDLYYLIQSTPVIRMKLRQMIDEVPLYYAQRQNDSYLHGYYIYSIDDMILMIDAAVQDSPPYNETALVGFPINIILNWTMGTPAGFDAFTHHALNQALKAILDDWGKFLESEASLWVKDSTEEGGHSVFSTHKDGWCGESALNQLHMEQFLEPDQLKLYKKGINRKDDVADFPYKSWNEFFIRPFLEGFRPVGDAEIISPCESQVFNIVDNARLEDWFWVKEQPYSLRDLIGFPNNTYDQSHYDNYIEPFEGAIVYQAFLAATKYHRWNSPLSGRIIKAYKLQGTYYSGALSEGMDPGSPDLSQGYIAHTAARAVYVFDTDIETEYGNLNLGKVIFTGIGMAEVSSCIIDEKVEKAINTQGYYDTYKGEEIGRFQYGGSTSCLIIPKNPKIEINRFLVNVGDNVKVKQNIYSFDPNSDSK